VHRLLRQQREDRLANGAAPGLMTEATGTVTARATGTPAAERLSWLIDGMRMVVMRPASMARAAKGSLSHVV
jgi:hypothetical protein